MWPTRATPAHGRDISFVHLGDHVKKSYWITVCAASLFIAGCTSTSPAPTRTVTVTSTVTASNPTSDDTTSTEGASSSDLTTPTDALTPNSGTDGVTTSTSTQLGPEDAGRTLGLSDFFDVDSTWSENRYGVAGRKEIPGIAAIVGCGTSSSQSLELRLTNSFKSLKFSVGQGNNSSKSTQILDVEVTANNTQKDIRRIPFNTVQPFALDVTDVNAVILTFYLDQQSGECQGQAQAVLFGGTVS